MTRKDFKVLAGILCSIYKTRDEEGNVSMYNVVYAFVEGLRHAYPRFNSVKFMEAYEEANTH